MIVLDTHAWIWWVIGDTRLTQTALLAIESADTVGVPAISCWEVALLVAHGRISLDRDVLLWIQESLPAPRVQLLELTPEIAVLSSRLEWSHRDPADRLIVATAIVHDASVVTKDGEISAFIHERTIW
jgi:PIN domain nuclease of toxin-antitoxin system